MYKRNALFACACSAALQAAALPHFLDPRAPHFSEIMAPEPDFVLRANGSLNDTVAFQYRNGGRAYESTMTVSLVNGNDTFPLASNITFYNSWYVNATLSIVYADIPDGNYTLVAEEYLDGDVYSGAQQPFSVSHDPNSGPPPGDILSVDQQAPPSSAYILQPGRQPATASSSYTDQPPSDGKTLVPSATGPEPLSAQATTPAHEHSGDDSIEEVLHLLVADLQSGDV